MVGYELDPCRVHGDGGELIAAGHVRSHEDGRLLIEVPRYSGGSLWPGDPETAWRLVQVSFVPPDAPPGAASATADRAAGQAAAGCSGD